ncbi:MAG: transporter substrate-binding domain-containing protein, partial [Alphaproteobacteria bacterium]|nr:transporter substrate-binding domain-containing protein [Alphaproteobacteria bacterium]
VPFRATVAKSPVRVVTEDYPPYEMATPMNGLRGFDYEVAVEVFKRMGVELDIQFLPWKRALREAELGDALGILTCARTKERSAFILYSEPLSRFTNGFFVRSGFSGPRPASLSEAKGLRVASVTAYESLQALIDAGLSPIEASTSETALKMLLAERFDYLYIGGEKTLFDLRQQGLEASLEFHPIVAKDFFFCFSKAYKGVGEYLTKFNKHLRDVKEDGSYDAIHDKYR